MDIIFPWFRGIGIQNIIEKLEFKESSVVEVCSKNCTEGLVSGNLCDWWLHKGQAGGIYENLELVEEEEEAELFMVYNISYIQAKQEGIIDALGFSLGRWVLKE